MVQYRGKDRIIVKEFNKPDGDFGYDFTGLATIHTQSGKSIYITKWICYASTRDIGAGVMAYELVGDSLKEYTLFKTPKKLLMSIAYGYDFFESSNKALSKDIHSLHWSDDLQKLYIPIVTPVHGTSGRVTDKYLVYIFDGEHFIFQKNAR